MPAESQHTGLLVDFGGVLTTSVWDSFADFCHGKDLDEDAVKRLFREALVPAAGKETQCLDTFVEHWSSPESIARRNQLAASFRR